MNKSRQAYVRIKSVRAAVNFKMHAFMRASLLSHSSKSATVKIENFDEKERNNDEDDDDEDEKSNQ